MTRTTRHKCKILLLSGGVAAAAYLSIKYILPLVWPFILAYGLALLIYPVVRFLRDKLHFHKNAATAMTLIVVLGGIGFLLSVLVSRVFEQMTRLVESWPTYESQILKYIKEMCEIIEKTFRIDEGQVYGRVYDGIGNAMTNWQVNIMPTLMNNSISTLIAFVDVIIIIAVTVIAVFYMARDMDDMRKIKQRNPFYKELCFVRGLMSKLVRAYIRSQTIIMSLVAVICAVGLAFVGNSYYILLGVIVGILDALPLIGVGVVMIPWSIVYMFMGEYLKAATMFTIFIICYLLREFLEPKLMGQKIGMSPIASLISIYVGYRLFGIIGMVAGPFVYVLVREIVANYDNS